MVQLRLTFLVEMVSSILIFLYVFNVPHHTQTTSQFTGVYQLPYKPFLLAYISLYIEGLCVRACIYVYIKGNSSVQFYGKWFAWNIEKELLLCLCKIPIHSRGTCMQPRLTDKASKCNVACTNKFMYQIR